MSAINNSNQESGLKLGQFRVKIKTGVTKDDAYVYHLVNPLTQEEMADGWEIVLPNAMKSSTVHHFSVYLSQLPPYLWRRLKTKHNESSEEYYVTIRDNIYHYSIKSSKYDEQLIMLYNEMMKRNPNFITIAELHLYLERQKVKGWIMIRAKHLLTRPRYV